MVWLKYWRGRAHAKAYALKPEKLFINIQMYYGVSYTRVSLRILCLLTYRQKEHKIVYHFFLIGSRRKRI